jgi:hypothetical protein
MMAAQEVRSSNHRKWSNDVRDCFANAIAL